MGIRLNYVRGPGLCHRSHDNIQGTELNYPYLLYNERVNFSKIYNSAAESFLFTGKTTNGPFDEELVFFFQSGISLLCFFEAEVILEV